MDIRTKVTWRRGHFTKRGIVCAVVPAGHHPRDIAGKMGYTEGQFVYGGGKPRDHESYLVAVDRKRKPLIYWPPVSALVAE